MIELTIPQAGEETKNLKDIIFSILSEKQSLSTIQVFNIIKKNFNVGATYQAVSKAVLNLVEKNVIKKEGKFFSINKDWLINTKIVLDKLISQSESEQEIKKFHKDFAHKEYAIYSFSNLYDLDSFWDDMLIHLANNLKEDEERLFLAHAHYGWWLLINLGKETKMFQHLLKKGLVCYNLFIGKKPLNLWAKKIYTDLGVKFKVIEDKDIDEKITLNVIGDTVIQVQYPESILIKLRLFYNKYKNTQDISTKEITDLAHEPCDLKFIVFKNKEIADGLKEKYKKKFK